MKWKETIDKYMTVLKAKRERVIEQLIKSCMGAQQRCFTLWSRWAYKVRNQLKKGVLRKEAKGNRGALGATKLEQSLQKLGRKAAPVKSGAPPPGTQGAQQGMDMDLGSMGMMGPKGKGGPSMAGRP
jgi:hypothetical protein